MDSRPNTTSGGASEDARSALEAELDPESGRRTLAVGVAVFRVGSLVWMAGFNIVSGGFSRPWLGYLSLAVVAVWTLYLVRRPQDQELTWALAVDVVLSAFLILISAAVVPDGGVVSPTRLFFATAYPVSTPLMWGMSRGIAGGLVSAAVLAVALTLTRPLNGVQYEHIGQVFAVANGAVYYLIGGGTMGAIAKSLDRSAASVRAAVDRVEAANEVAIRDREIAAGAARQEAIARRVHETVLRRLGQVIKRARRSSAEARRPDSTSDMLGELSALADEVSTAERELRRITTHQPEEAPAGTVSLRSALEEDARRATAVPVEVIAVGPLWVDARQCPIVIEAVREALANTAQYAEASRVVVFADEEDGWLDVSVRDNGNGFVYNEAELRGAGAFGIVNSIKRPIEALGGRVRIIAAPGFGTEVDIRVPSSAVEESQ